jgi:hypothetical protein
MWIRIARFEGADPAGLDQRVDVIKNRLQGDGGTASGERQPLKRAMLLADRQSGRGVGLQFADSEEDIRRVDQFLDRMTPPPGAGTRSSVEIYEVLLDEKMG